MFYSYIMSLKSELFCRFLKKNHYLQEIINWDEKQEVIVYLQNDKKVVITYPLMYGLLDRTCYFNYEDKSLISKNTLLFASAMKCLPPGASEYKYIITKPLLIDNPESRIANQYIRCITDKLRTHFPLFVANDYKLFYTAQSIFINAHYDPVNRLMIQLKGTKRISLLPSKYIFRFCLYPTTHVAERNIMIDDIRLVDGVRENILEFTLNEGDTLLIPKYWIHQIETDSESLSLTLSEKSVLLNESSLQTIAKKLEVLDLLDDSDDKNIFILQLRDMIDIYITKCLGIDTLKDFHIKWLREYYPDNLSTDNHILQLYNSILTSYPILQKLYYPDVNRFFIEHTSNYKNLFE